jgi:hypothetical protein
MILLYLLYLLLSYTNTFRFDTFCLFSSHITVSIIHESMSYISPSPIAILLPLFLLLMFPFSFSIPMIPFCSHHDYAA